MNTKLFILALLELGLALVVGVLILYIAYSLINKWIKQKYHIENNNVAFAVACASILFSVGYIISGTIEPMLSTIRVLSAASNKPEAVGLAAAQYIFLFVVIGLLVSLLINLAAIYLYTRLTKINEFEELSKNNIAVGIVLGAIVIVIAMFVRQPVILLLESIVPYPQIPFEPMK